MNAGGETRSGFTNLAEMKRNGAIFKVASVTRGWDGDKESRFSRTIAHAEWVKRYNRI